MSNVLSTNVWLRVLPRAAAVALLDSVATQSYDLTRMKDSVPFQTDCVPHHNTSTGRAVSDLQLCLRKTDRRKNLNPTSKLSCDA